MDKDALMQTYARLPVTFEHGEGVWLVDDQGRRYLDAMAGIAVNSLGHAHPAVVQTVCEQARRLIHTSNVYRVAAQGELGERLTALAGMDRAFFGNSGAEANEAAIKLARMHGHQREVDDPAIVVMEGSFHGRTLATLSASGSRRVQAGFEPLVQGFRRVPYNDLEAVATVARHDQNVVAVLVEPIQGERGVVVPSDGYLRGLRRICDENGWLLMLDEIQTGMCRTGHWFACQGEDVQPDVISVAKALANGVPIGACLARGAAAEVLRPGTHGSTFGGNPLACATALAVVDVMEREGIAAHAAAMGERLLAGLRTALAGVACVREVRGRGLMVGVALDRPCKVLTERALAKGLLINVTGDSVIRLLPPLIIQAQEIDAIIAGVGELVREFDANP